MRFKVGDQVVIVAVRRSATQGYIGKFATIVGVGPYPANHLYRDGRTSPYPGDYELSVDGDPDLIWSVLDHQVEKRSPPSQADLSSWKAIERIVGWHPERETV